MQHGITDASHVFFYVDLDAFSTCNTGFTHAARDHGGMRGFTATAGQHALGSKKSVDIFRFGLFTYQDNFFTFFYCHFVNLQQWTSRI